LVSMKAIYSNRASICKLQQYAPADAQQSQVGIGTGLACIVAVLSNLN
jgi:hypothetical protein